MSSVLAATVLLASSARGAATSDSDAFRQLPVSAAEAAFGQATIAVVHDATAFHWNPGGLGMLTGIDAGASYSKLYQGLGSYHMFAAANKQEKQIWRGIASSEFLLHGSATVGAVAVQ